MKPLGAPPSSTRSPRADSEPSPYLALPSDEPALASGPGTLATTDWDVPRAELRASVDALRARWQDVLCASWGYLLRRLSGQRAFLLRCSPPTALVPFECDDPVTFPHLVGAVHTRLAAHAGTVPFRAGDSAEPPLHAAEVAFRVAHGHDDSAPPSAEFADLTLEFQALGDTPRWRLAYRQPRTSSARAAHLLAQLRGLLEQATAAPEAPLATLSLVTPEAHPLLPDPAAPLDRPEPASVVTRFAEWAARAPQRPAVRQGATALSYGELATAAAAVAHRLRATGLVPGEVVALQGRRCPGLLSCMLGTLAAGGVILILDEDLPTERKTLLLRRARSRLLLRLESTPASDAAPGPAPLHVHPTSGSPLDTPAGPRPPLPASPEGGAPAYLFFTSGSTGTPKGVLGCHRGLSHFIQWQREAFHVGPEDRCAQLTRLSFDVMLRDVFLPLTSGACLCLPEPEETLPHRVVSWLRDSGVTLLHAVPSLARLWLAHTPPDVVPERLRVTFFAGEPLPDALVRAWRQAFPTAGRQVNLYGPTETTLAKCAHVLEDALLAGIQPVGRPLPQTQVLVLGEADRPQGIGEVGELVIRTPFRSLGYLDAPAAEQARFRPNPFTHDPDDLVYSTGDLGRYRPDGTLEILGRLDHQVKIRGVRVEPSEVEAALRDCEGVRDGAVAARELSAGDPQLVAYFVPGTPAPTPVQLRRRLERTLPAWMVPTVFISLEQLPLSANGKLDRHALPDPLPALALAPREEPGTETERRIARLWHATLGVDAVGAEQDFFTVGGDSLKALVLASRLSTEFHLPLSAATAYAHPTIQGQAAWVDEARVRPRLTAPGHIVFGPGRPHLLFAFPPLLGFGLTFYRLAAFLPSHTLYAFDFEESQDPISAYVDAVLRIAPGGPHALLGYSAGGNLAFEVAAGLERRGHRVRAVIMLDAERFVQPELLSDEEIERTVRLNLAHLAGLLAQDEQFRAFLESEGAREQLAGRLRAFLRYERGRTNDGPIQADIHYLHSSDRDICRSWAEVTRGHFTLQAGSGTHMEMLLGPHTEANGRLVEAILRALPPGAEKVTS